MGIEPDAMGLAQRSAAGISLVNSGEATRGDARNRANSRSAPETSPEIAPARAAYLEQLQHAIKRAVERRDWAAAARLAGGLEAELVGIAGTSDDDAASARVGSSRPSSPLPSSRRPR